MGTLGRLGIALAVLCAAASCAPKPEERASTDDGGLVRRIRPVPPISARAPNFLCPADRKGWIPRVAAAPALDGVIGEDEWRGATTFSGYTAVEGFAANQTVARVCRDDANLYLAFHCRLPAGTGELSASKARDRNVWQDESIEIFIDPGRTKKVYYQFIVNTLGTQQDSKGWEGNWNAEWQAKTRVEKDFWEAEVAIPFAALENPAPKDWESWGLNLNRNDKRAGEHSSWSHLLGNAHDPARFGVVTFGPAPEVELIVEGGSRSAQAVSAVEARLVNRGARALKGGISATVSGEGAERATPTKTATIEAPAGTGTTRTLAVPLPTPGAGVLSLTWQPAVGGAMQGERLTWALPKRRPLKLTACEDESYLSENTISVYARTELDNPESMSLEVSLVRAESGRAVRTARIAALPAADSQIQLAVGGLAAGRYRVRARLIGPGGVALGEDAAPFVRGRGPFD